ncbi:unnamed protein product [Rhodiola kirilowii]
MMLRTKALRSSERASSDKDENDASDENVSWSHQESSSRSAIALLTRCTHL